MVVGWVELVEIRGPSGSESSRNTAASAGVRTPSRSRLSAVARVPATASTSPICVRVGSGRSPRTSCSSRSTAPPLGTIQASGAASSSAARSPGPGTQSAACQAARVEAALRRERPVSSAYASASSAV